MESSRYGGPLMDLDDNWLNEAVGWKVAKEARQMRKAGVVLEAGWEGSELRGLVLRAGKPNLAGFAFGKGRFDLTNLCQCPAARRTGEMCAHSSAVALAVIHGDPAKARVEEGVAESTPEETAKREPVREEREPVLVSFHERWLELWKKDRVPVKLETGEKGDRPIWSWMDARGVKSLPAQLVLTGEKAADLLRGLSGKQGMTVGDQSWTVAELPAARLRVEFRGQGEGFQLKPLSWRQEGQVLLRGGSDHWVAFPERGLLQPLRPAPSGMTAPYERLLRGDTVNLSAGELLAALAEWQECLEFRFEPGAELTLETAPVRFHLRLEGSLNALAGRVQLEYPGGIAFGLGEDPPGGTFPVRPAADEGRFWTRNRRAEERAIHRLTEELGFSGPDAAGQFQLRGEPDIGRFLARGLPALKEDWEVELGERFQYVIRQVTVIKPQLERGATSSNWLSFAIRYGEDGGGEVSRQEIQKLLNKGQNKIQLANGKTAFVDLEACAEVDEILFDAQPVQEDGAFRVRAEQGAYLASALGQGDLYGEEEVDLSGLGRLGDRMRPYQREGVSWIYQRLDGGAQAALLADEMGLGKTVQSLAAGELMLQEEEGQVLVVCPTSLLSNWVREVEQFLEGRKVVVMHGPKRWERQEEREAADILVTSYALLVRDLERWREREFTAVILDEAGAIKNPDTKNAKAACALRASYRLALTGTPVENSVRELWSLFQFLLPGYLGSRQEFRDRYETPLAGGSAPREVMGRLRQRVRPLMLRRTKDVVARELPAKLEQVRYCELSSAQAKLYESILRESRKRIDEALSAKSEGQARMTILTALLRLRQLCCDPRLLKLDEKEKIPSGKLDLFSEMLEECRSGGHRLLVFSQFTGMLAILRETLEAAGQEYCYLDGSSTDRAEQVDRFQRGEDAGVFLISLKAGGYGLNLTRADTVIHYDPWWNPAVEAQATDRAHRIGQTRVVTSCKLIASGTVEEKILELQQKKKAVIEAALEDEEPLMQGLSTRELVEVVS